MKLSDLSFVVILVIFFSCNTITEDLITKESEIRLTSSINPLTRTTDQNLQSTQIVAGQQVGVAITGAKSVHNNIAWTVGEDGSLTNTDDAVYYGDNEVTITAYHPYNEDWTSTSHIFSVNTDQSTEKNYLNSDLLWTTKDASRSVNPVSLTFAHKLAKINVTLGSSDITDLSGATISICNTKISTTFNPATGEISDATGDPKEIKAGVTTDDVYTASAIVIPQEVSGKIIKVTHEGKTYYYTLASAKELEAGHSYSYTLAVKGNQLINIGSSINPWEDENGNEGDTEKENDIPYLTFKANAEQTLTMSKEVATLEYSVNGGEWNTLGTAIVTFGGKNGDLRLRGKSSIGTAIYYDNYSNISFGNVTSVACTGDIRTLVDYENYASANTSKARFCSLFKICKSLTTVPELPATTLTSYCYTGMFSSCTSLTEAPELPATTLASDCYNGMFSGCTSLTEAPELPATTLASNCYNGMFSGCTSLTKAPKLPATTLASNCYSYMFSGCTSLTEAPKLPATT
ncbi:MAG: fimbrillin family protein, partial [Parabacteroides sp.]|nr:fimbrillin family protein [Parabacteroides sp.]